MRASSIGNAKNWSDGRRQAGAWNCDPDLHKGSPGPDLYDSRFRADISRCAGDYLDTDGPFSSTLAWREGWRDLFSSTSLVPHPPELVSHDHRQEPVDGEGQKKAAPDIPD